MADYQDRPNRSRDDFSRDFDRRDETLSLREQLKRWGTPEEKKMIAEIERKEEEAREKKRRYHGDDPEKINIVPNFSKHDLKKDY